MVGLTYLYASFQPRLRFADPAPNEPLQVKRNYPCYHDKLYLGTSQSDALFFGASKTHHAVDADVVENAYEAITGKALDAFAFDTPESNPEMAYFLFRDYLTNNPRPQVALFSLTSIGQKPPPIRYMHPLFADLAPPYLYLDVLHSSKLVHHKIFAASDFLQLLVRHLDLSLTRLLLADVRFVVPRGDNCSAAEKVSGLSRAEAAQFDSFEGLLQAQVNKNRPAIEADDMGSIDSLLDAYHDKRSMTSTLKRLQRDKTQLEKRHFWHRGINATDRSRDYYRRIVALGKAHDVTIGFYYLPNIYSRETHQEEIDQVAKELGAPVFVLPYDYMRVSYYHHKDPAHINPSFKPAYSIWFASIIDRLGKG
jgi:hypothetical protein